MVSHRGTGERAAVRQEPLVLPPEATSPRTARRWAGSQVRALGEEGLVEVVELLVTEVVTNSVLHAGTTVRITIEPTPQGGVRVDVWDGSVVRPRRTLGYSRTATTGRGSLLLDSLAASWGAAAADGGKVTWFVVERDEPPLERTTEDLMREWSDD